MQTCSTYAREEKYTTISFTKFENHRRRWDDNIKMGLKSGGQLLLL